MGAPGNRTAMMALATLVVAFLAATSPTLIRPHSNGDQRVYVAMAMKLRHQGGDGYNVRQVGMVRDGDWVVYRLVPGQGHLLRSFLADGTPFYDQPLMHAPPLFSMVIDVTHRLTSAETYRVLAHDRADTHLSRGERARGQFAAVAPSWLFGGLLLLATYALGTQVLDRGAALAATGLLAASPVLWLASQRIWADTLLATASTLALVWAVRFARRRGVSDVLGCGLALSAALLTKNNAVLGVVAVIVVVIWRRRGGLGRPDALALGGVALVIAIATAAWYSRVHAAFGTFFFNPASPGIAASHPWFAYINSRPWSTYLIGIPFQNPLFALGLLATPVALARRDDGWLGAVAWLYLIALTVATARSEMLGPDHRYMLPAYPLLALATAATLQRGVARWGGRGRWMAGGAVVASIAWSLNLAWTRLDTDLIALPF